MIVARRGFVAIGSVFLDDEGLGRGVDIVNYVHRLHPLDALPWDESHTLMVDLRRDADALLAQIAANTCYKLRRAEQRERIRCEAFSVPDQAVLRAFCGAFNAFAAQKRRPRVHPGRLGVLAADGILALSRATGPDSVPLAWHTYLCVGKRARLLHSCSLFRS